MTEGHSVDQIITLLKSVWIYVDGKRFNFAGTVCERKDFVPTTTYVCVKKKNEEEATGRD